MSAALVRRVVQDAAGFVLTANDWPLALQSKEQQRRWDALCESLQELQDATAAERARREGKP